VSDPEPSSAVLQPNAINFMANTNLYDMTSRQCYALIVYPFLDLPLFIALSCLVHRRVTPRSPARPPREVWIRVLLIFLAILLIASQGFGIALSTQSGRIAILGGDSSDPGEAQIFGLLFLIVSGIFFLMCGGLSMLFIWHI